MLTVLLSTTKQLVFDVFCHSFLTCYLCTPALVLDLSMKVRQNWPPHRTRTFPTASFGAPFGIAMLPLFQRTGRCVPSASKPLPETLPVGPTKMSNFRTFVDFTGNNSSMLGWRCWRKLRRQPRPTHSTYAKKTFQPPGDEGRRNLSLEIGHFKT